MPDPEFDVAVIGAGPVGCALALALQESGMSVALVANPGPTKTRGPLPPQAAVGPAVRPAVRPIVLSYASRLILERIGAWNALATTPIEQIHVSQAGGFGRTRISRTDVGLPALGYVTAYDDFAPRLASRVDAAKPGSPGRPDTVDALHARLVVHAEGSPGEQAIGKDYGYAAIVATVECDRPSHGMAWERFTAEGPLALLPLADQYAIVWSRTAAAASRQMQADDASFLAALQAAFGQRAGRFRAVGARASAPLALRYRACSAKPGELHIGNAAQSLHPVAGQGLNLGLRDAWDLACLLRDAPREALGSAPLAARFARARRRDTQAAIRGTDLLATLYTRTDPLSAVLRSAALTAFDLCPPARRALARRMIYGASAR